MVARPGAQSVAPPQLVLQSVAPHTYAPQATSAPMAQVPLPSHFGATVSVPPVHESAPQTVPAA